MIVPAGTKHFRCWLGLCCDPTGRRVGLGSCVFLEIFDPCRDQGKTCGDCWRGGYRYVTALRSGLLRISNIQDNTDHPLPPPKEGKICREIGAIGRLQILPRRREFDGLQREFVKSVGFYRALFLFDMLPICVNS